MKKLLGMLLTGMLCVSMVTPVFAAEDLYNYHKEGGDWYWGDTLLTGAYVYALELGEQFVVIPDERERVKAVADYIKDNFEWDLQFRANFEIPVDGKTRHFHNLYRCMLEGAGINVVGTTNTHYINRTFDNTCETAQDVVIELNGQRYWSSALMYKYHGDEYLLVDHIPATDHTGAYDFDLEGNSMYEEFVPLPEDEVVYGNVLTD
ncbi:MAG: hypothetical protein LUH21_12070 [Clostridiales bacterium]|nr:hypothetical protein [Clostridiales bacterium]